MFWHVRQLLRPIAVWGQCPRGLGERLRRANSNSPSNNRGRQCGSPEGKMVSWRPAKGEPGSAHCLNRRGGCEIAVAFVLELGEIRLLEEKLRYDHLDLLEVLVAKSLLLEEYYDPQLNLYDQTITDITDCHLGASWRIFHGIPTTVAFLMCLCAKWSMGNSK